MFRTVQLLSFLIFIIPGIVLGQSNHLHQFKNSDPLIQLIHNNDEIAYSAIYSLPITQPIFLNVTGDKGWSSFFPKDLPDQLSKKQKALILENTDRYFQSLNKVKQKQYLQRLSNWIIAERQISLFQQITSIEQTVAAIYQNPHFKKYFIPFLKQRNLRIEHISAEMVATTLSSAEITEISYPILNQLSLMSQKELLQYFRNVYAILLKDLNSW